MLYPNRRKTRVRKACRDDVSKLHKVLRSMDIAELESLRGQTAKEELQASFDKAMSCWTVELNDNVIAMFGVGRLPREKAGIVWLLASDSLYEIAFKFARESKIWIDFLMSEFHTLENMVLAENTIAIKWLHSLGFKFVGTRVDIGSNKAEFWKFHLSKTELERNKRLSNTNRIQKKKKTALRSLLFPLDETMFLKHNFEKGNYGAIPGFKEKFDFLLTPDDLADVQAIIDQEIQYLGDTISHFPSLDEFFSKIGQELQRRVVFSIRTPCNKKSITYSSRNAQQSFILQISNNSIVQVFDQNEKKIWARNLMPGDVFLISGPFLFKISGTDSRSTHLHANYYQ